MSAVRDRNSILHQQEIEAIKINQDIIRRMADNSQKIKTVFLSIFALFFVFLEKSTIEETAKIWICLLFIGIPFWYMDARYLRLERQFREHHKAIIHGTIPYLKQWSFNPNDYSVPNIFKTMFCSFSEIIYPAVMVLSGTLLYYLPAR